MEGIVATIVIFVFSALLLFAFRADDMAQCQKTHSYEVCVHELNH